MTALLHQHEHTDVKLISLKNMFSFVSCEYGRPQEFGRLGNFFEIWEAEFWGGHYTHFGTAALSPREESPRNEVRIETARTFSVIS